MRAGTCCESCCSRRSARQITFSPHESTSPTKSIFRVHKPALQLPKTNETQQPRSQQKRYDDDDDGYCTTFLRPKTAAWAQTFPEQVFRVAQISQCVHRCTAVLNTIMRVRSAPHRQRSMLFFVRLLTPPPLRHRSPEPQTRPISEDTICLVTTMLKRNRHFHLFAAKDRSAKSILNPYRYILMILSTALEIKLTRFFA